MALAMSRPWKHPTTGIYWLRKRVPDELRAIVGKREEKLSLRTRDPAEAKQRHLKVLAEIETRWANLRQSSNQIETTELQRATAQTFDYCLASNGIPGVDWRAGNDENIWALSPVPVVGNTIMTEILLPKALRESQWCQGQADAYIAARGLRIDEGSRLNLAKAIGFGVQRAMAELEKRAKGDFSASFERGLASSASNLVITPKPKPPATFESLLHGWAVEKRPSEKTVYSWTRVLDQLGEFVGHTDAAQLTQDDLFRWKASLIENGLRTKTIRDSKVAPLRAILQWGMDNGKLAANPASRVIIDVRAKMDERIRGFTEEEAALILRQAEKERDPIRRWVPFLCAYSGARLSEVCQLRHADIFQQGSVWGIKFDPKAGSLKNVNSERAIPLHPAVVESEFLKFVDSVGAGPLFADLAADRFGNRGGNGTKIIGRWVRGLGLIDERISPSHSWRHRFKTLGRRHGLTPDIVNAITGHHRKTVADAYGEFEIEALYREIRKIPPVLLK